MKRLESTLVKFLMLQYSERGIYGDKLPPKRVKHV